MTPERVRELAAKLALSFAAEGVRSIDDDDAWNHFHRELGELPEEEREQLLEQIAAQAKQAQISVTIPEGP